MRKQQIKVIVVRGDFAHTRVSSIIAAVEQLCNHLYNDDRLSAGLVGDWRDPNCCV